ncbi:phosphoribosyl 1,2-cyclic phosphodiesterase [Pelomonas saccharophila]|jgi:phosphoribosyl 1,2-cyclic phosphodiesterase|uniref:Phosphoribosyl 1,2-cyclic phosphodiesterase n=1 Tax=Roseateles saccharophilus TaxID=304 RepID=A0ABU1YU11_ROSSA|nr:MBL fold metallo-hydrolase [Roseateles saccharophilus]MDR7272340.1 phosphoribosyl 1,2-cyclic phosphodiesterase [Roseateles saccharophilus]
MRFCSLGSGSGGNSTLIEASQGITSTRLLVDAGFSVRELVRRLARAGCAPEEVDAVFITHEHGDHIGCALAFASKYRRPLIMSRGTWRAVGNADLDPGLLRIAKDGETMPLGDMVLKPFAVPHDANEPLQLVLDDGVLRLGIVTDLGCAPAGVAAALAGCQALLLECNHDEGLLRTGPYHPALKKRILGSHGHLSNAAAADLLSRCLHQGLKTIAAAHLSEHNNTPELARGALAEAVGGGESDIRVAHPSLGLDWVALG